MMNLLNNKIMLSIMCLLIALFFQVNPVHSQQGAYEINLRRNFGYGGGVNIRGTFTIHLVGDETNVKSVSFYIDGERMATISAEPFNYRFHTDDYGFGNRRLWAEVKLQDGKLQRTPEVRYNFISPADERRQVGTLIGGLVGVVVFTLVVVAIIQTVVFKRRTKQPHKPGQARNYGLLGPTICPKCGRPFPRHIWGINLLVGRLDRCEHCGKWVMTVRATPTALSLAEEAEQADPSLVFRPSSPQKEQEDRLEDTKYIDHI